MLNTTVVVQNNVEHVQARLTNLVNHSQQIRTCLKNCTRAKEAHMAGA